jgi:ribosomal protein S18 acetylase RimI-like enzyme
LNFRDIQTSDIESCSTLFAAVFSAPPWNENWTPENARRRLGDCAATPGFIGLLAEDEHGIAAFAFGYLQHYMDEQHYNLLEFCVAPRIQRQGVGHALLAELNTRLSAAGASRVCTLTARDTPAQKFYEKAGFYVSPKMILMARRFSA